MKIAVWGAGEIGSGLAYRLATTPFTSTLYWINRSLDSVQVRAVDLAHGLDFAPCCRRVIPVDQRQATQVLPKIDVLVLALGAPVPKDARRQDLYATNAKGLRASVIPALRGTDRPYQGIVLVITNPLDLMTRLVWKEGGLDEQRVIGLGTVVETARLKASLASHLRPERAAREIWAFAVGTHDERFVPVVKHAFSLATGLDDDDRNIITDLARDEVAAAPRRVKAGGRSTLHPVVEGAIKVVEAVALDTHAVLTVAVRDPATADDLFYSLPCTVGRSGVVRRLADIEEDRDVADRLEECRKTLRATLREAGELPD